MLFDKFQSMADFQTELAEREVTPFGAVTEKILSATEGIVEGHQVILAGGLEVRVGTDSPADPRPEIAPSSEAASVKPMEIPAPIEAARPMRKVFHVSPVAKAAAKMGASVETEPSISPARPGCTQVSTNWRWAVRAS